MKKKIKEDKSNWIQEDVVNINTADGCKNYNQFSYKKEKLEVSAKITTDNSKEKDFDAKISYAATENTNVAVGVDKNGGYIESSYKFMNTAGYYLGKVGEQVKNICFYTKINNEGVNAGIAADIKGTKVSIGTDGLNVDIDKGQLLDINVEKEHSNNIFKDIDILSEHCSNYPYTMDKLCDSNSNRRTNEKLPDENKCCSKCNIFSIISVKYNNPLLNHPEILQNLSKNLGVTYGEVIDRSAGFDKEFVEQVCLAGNVELLKQSLSYDV